jgi:hypothetical protein
VISRDSDTHKEDTVDDFLHAQILLAVAKSQRNGDKAGKNTLVLATGVKFGPIHFNFSQQNCYFVDRRWK